MTAVDRIKEICKERKIPISRLEKECGFANAYVSNLREGMMPADRLYKVANYLDVSPEYLMTGKHAPKQSIEGTTYYFNDKTAEMAQALFESKEMRLLFEAAKGKDKDLLNLTTEMLQKYKGTNPEG